MVSVRFLSQLIFSGVALAGTLEPRAAKCTSDDACKAVCSAPSPESRGINVTPSQEVIAEARRRFQDFHCVKGTCSCAITSDDQAEEFCKYWIEHDKADFAGARYVNGGVDADRGVIYCVYARPA